MLQSLDWSVMYETGEGCWSQICLTAKISAVLDCRHSTGSHQLFSWEGLTDSYTPLTDWMSVTLCLCVTRSDWPVVRSCGHSFISITTGDWFLTLAWLQPKQPCDPLIRRATGRSRFAAKFKETGEKASKLYMWTIPYFGIEVFSTYPVKEVGSIRSAITPPQLRTQAKYITHQVLISSARDYSLWYLYILTMLRGVRSWKIANTPSLKWVNLV